MDELPNEIVLQIFKNLSSSDLKTVTLISHRFHPLASLILWSAPIFKRIKLITNDAVELPTCLPCLFLKPDQLAHLPIRVLSTKHFKFESYEQLSDLVLDNFKLLTSLKIAGIERIKSIDDLRYLLKLPLKRLHTRLKI